MLTRTMFPATLKERSHIFGCVCHFFFESDENIDITSICVFISIFFPRCQTFLLKTQLRSYRNKVISLQNDFTDSLGEGSATAHLPRGRQSITFFFFSFRTREHFLHINFKTIKNAYLLQDMNKYSKLKVKTSPNQISRTKTKEPEFIQSFKIYPHYQRKKKRKIQVEKDNDDTNNCT